MKRLAVICAIVALAMPLFGQGESLLGVKLMVDQNGEVYPKGATLGLSDIAALAAASQLAEAKIKIVKEVQAETAREVDLVVKTLTDVNAYAYVEDFVESLGVLRLINAIWFIQIIVDDSNMKDKFISFKDSKDKNHVKFKKKEEE